MPYIDKTYYRETYVGIDADDTTLDSAIAKASRMIDQATNYQIVNAGGLTEFDLFVQDRVKTATAAQAEYFIINGDESHNTGDSDDADGFTLGKLKIDDKSQSNENLSRDQKRFSPEAKAELIQSGLLYRGTISRGNGVFDNA